MTGYVVGETFESTTEDVDRMDFVKYAGAIGVFTLVHYDGPFTTDTGYKSVFAQGMFTRGVASRTIREAFGLHHLAEYRMRFVSQVWPCDTLTTTAEVTAIVEIPDGTRVEAALTVTNQDNNVKAVVLAQLSEFALGDCFRPAAHL